METGVLFWDTLYTEPVNSESSKHPQGTDDIPCMYHVLKKREHFFRTPCILNTLHVTVLNISHCTDDIPDMYHVAWKREYFFGTPRILNM